MRATILAVITLLLVSCEKQTENYTADKAADYLPLTVGKYRIYKLDSTVVVNFGNSLEVHSYQEKQVVDAAITENGRTGYRILVYHRDAAGTEPWKAGGSFFASADNNVEVTENNLRFIKLANPLRTDVIWKGNAYLAQDPYSALYEFNNDNDMSAWIYTYTGVGESLSVNGNSYDDVVTVKAIDETLNFPVASTQQYAYKNYSLEQYAKGVGLVYQEMVMLEYQPQNADRPGYRGFAVKRTLLEHN